MERDVVPPGELPPINFTTGRVAYTSGAALDHPLAVHRFDFRDSVFVRYDTSAVPLEYQPLTIYPHTNWRGDYQIGTYVTGETRRCTEVPLQPEDYETVDGTESGESTVTQTHTHCPAPVPWAAKYIWLDHSRRAVAPPGNPDLWVGSLVKNKRDLTGNLYMRNRYYDAQAGRFSQEDPIGLAGGLNAYGFAAGDPVSYSDPYGLCPCRISENGYNFIRRHEQFRSNLYRDAVGNPTIGWGHLLQPGERFPNGITRAQGDALFAQDVAEKLIPTSTRLPRT